MQRKHLAVAGLCTVLLVSGCSNGGGTGIDLLEEPATAGDSLLADGGNLDDSVLQQLQPETARFVAEHEGVSYYFAKPAEPNAATDMCIVAAEPGVIGCSGASGLTVGFEGKEARSVRDGADTTDLTEDGWTQIHENLLVR